MKIFVSGAAGFLGSAVVNELARRGHEVIALDSEVKRAGEEAYLEESLLEEGELESIEEGFAIEEEEPSLAEEDIELKQTDMPAPEKPGDIRYFYGDQEDVRLEWVRELKDSDRVISLTKPFSEEEDITIDEINEYGKKHAREVTTLLKHAAGGKVKAAIITYHTLCLGNRGGAEVTEVDALNPVGFCRPLEGSFEAITQAGKDAKIRLISLYPSMVYGNGGWFKTLVDNIVTGKAKIVEPGDNFISLLHIDDLAGLYAEIVEKIDQDAIYTLSDGVPVAQKELAVHIAGLLGAGIPQMVDFEAYARKFGRLQAESMSASIKVNANKVLEDTGYKLKYPGYKTGIPQVLKSMGFEIGGEELKRAA